MKLVKTAEAKVGLRALWVNRQGSVEVPIGGLEIRPAEIDIAEQSAGFGTPRRGPFRDRRLRQSLADAS
ncbi:MAG: hypothetical protein ACLQIS_00255 [Bryobacteraceae bacterium]